jgi:hypothetical protein
MDVLPDTCLIILAATVSILNPLYKIGLRTAGSVYLIDNGVFILDIFLHEFDLVVLILIGNVPCSYSCILSTRAFRISSYY